MLPSPELLAHSDYVSQLPAGLIHLWVHRPMLRWPHRWVCASESFGASDGGGSGKCGGVVGYVPWLVNLPTSHLEPLDHHLHSLPLPHVNHLRLPPGRMYVTGDTSVENCHSVTTITIAIMADADTTAASTIAITCSRNKF